MRIYKSSAEDDGWIQARNEDLPRIEVFLRKHEAQALNLIESFFSIPQSLKGEKRTLEAQKSSWWIFFYLHLNSENSIDGCLALNQATYLHIVCDPLARDIVWASIFKRLNDQFPFWDKQLFGLLSTGLAFEKLAPFIPLKPRLHNYYKLLHRMNGVGSEPAPLVSGLSLHRADSSDIPGLLPLQMAYEEEEVLIPGQKAQAKQCRGRLQEQIKHNRLHFARLYSEAVAKAGINTVSWNYAQIGGVYTVPEYRNRGIAQNLMLSLLNYLDSEGLNASLFVKTENEAALQAYSKLHFQFCGNLEIVYFNAF